MQIYCGQFELKNNLNCILTDDFLSKSYLVYSPESQCRGADTRTDTCDDVQDDEGCALQELKRHFLNHFIAPRNCSVELCQLLVYP